jgi:hypothetical protein
MWKTLLGWQVSQVVVIKLPVRIARTWRDGRPGLGTATPVRRSAEINPARFRRGTREHRFSQLALVRAEQDGR